MEVARQPPGTLLGLVWVFLCYFFIPFYRREN